MSDCSKTIESRVGRLLSLLDKYAGEYNSIEIYKIEIAIIIAKEMLYESNNIWNNNNEEKIIRAKYEKYWSDVEEALVKKLL